MALSTRLVGLLPPLPAVSVLGPVLHITRPPARREWPVRVVTCVGGALRNVNPLPFVSPEFRAPLLTWQAPQTLSLFPFPCLFFFPIFPKCPHRSTITHSHTHTQHTGTYAHARTHTHTHTQRDEWLQLRCFGSECVELMLMGSWDDGL